jgi:hypothetical protein
MLSVRIEAFVEVEVPMPMWITWINPRTQKREHIYNHYEKDDSAGGKAIRISQQALSGKSRIPIEDIPWFRVERALWASIPVFRDSA